MARFVDICDIYVTPVMGGEMNFIVIVMLSLVVLFCLIIYVLSEKMTMKKKKGLG